MKTSRSGCSEGLERSAGVRSYLMAQGALGWALVLFTACGNGGNGGLDFSPPKSFSTGPAPLAVAAADVNGDGRLDLVATNSGNDTASVLLGVGDGTFQGARSFSVGFAVTHLALADLNADSRVDLVTVHPTGGNAQVRLGNGDGTFQGAQDYVLGDRPSTVTVSDVNKDGRPDLLVVADSAALQARAIQVLLGNGDGTFQDPSPFASGAYPFQVAVADFNGDGNVDVASAVIGFTEQTSDFRVHLGNGDGTFQGPSIYLAGLGAWYVTAVDLNGDNRVDLVTSNYWGQSASVLLSNGDGSFRVVPPVALGNLSFNPVAGDFNRDGRTDIAIANRFGQSVSILAGNGDGTLRARRDLSIGTDPAFVAAGDFDQDGSVDLATANVSTNNVEVLLNLR
jgi:hypothetical protein